MEYQFYEVRKSYHLLHHSSHWHIGWNLFAQCYRSYGVHFKHYKNIGNDYCFWINFGKGQFNITFRPKAARGNKEEGFDA